MIDEIIDLFGQYQPITDSVTGEYICADYTYILAGVVFCIVLWFTLSFIKTFLCGVMNRRW